MRRFLVTGAAVGLLALAGATSAATPTKLRGTVGPGFTISVKTLQGKTVRILKPGLYAFVVRDKANIHDFTIKGPGITRRISTGLSFVGTKTLTVTLKRGTYTFYCSLHLFKTTVRVS